MEEEEWGCQREKYKNRAFSNKFQKHDLTTMPAYDHLENLFPYLIIIQATNVERTSRGELASLYK